MWDQMSNEPRPSNNECAMDVVWTILHTKCLRYTPYNVNNIKYRVLLKKGNELMKKVPDYSLTCWYMGGREDLLKEMEIWLMDRNTKLRRKIKGLLKSLSILYILYKETLERYYLPGGKFEEKASLEWNPRLANDGYDMPIPPRKF
jgi:hypothetical protein